MTKHFKTLGLSTILAATLLLSGCSSEDYATTNKISASAMQGKQLTIPLGGVSIDEPVDENTTTSTGISLYNITKHPKHGSASVLGETLTYTPNKTYEGSDEVRLEYGTESKADYHLVTVSITVKDINFAPTISGKPTTVIALGEAYNFKPTAMDDDPQDTLTFSIANKPKWATFSTATGTLDGNASLDGGKKSEDAGNTSRFFNDVSITVTDGIESKTLDTFAIEVLQ